MNDPKQLLQRAAGLARMGWTDHDAAALEPQVRAILEAFRVISELDVEGVPPTLGATLLEDVKRPDVARTSHLAEQLLEGAPKSQDRCFVVPKAIGGGE